MEELFQYLLVNGSEVCALFEVLLLCVKELEQGCHPLLDNQPNKFLMMLERCKEREGRWILAGGGGGGFIQLT